MSTTMAVPTTGTARRRHRNANRRARMIYNVRNHGEKFEPWLRDIVNDTRTDAINVLGDVWDWDCHRCKLAVVTHRLTDPCPHCGSPDGVSPSAEERLLSAIVGR